MLPCAAAIQSDPRHSRYFRSHACGRRVWIGCAALLALLFGRFSVPSASAQVQCSCAGQRDPAGNLYETSYFGSTPNHPFPGEVSVGIPRQVVTTAGKSTTKITYVQSMARRVEVRITAESNGVTSFVDDILPIVKDDE